MKEPPMREQLHFEDVSVGDELPVYEKVVDPRQLFYFSSATQNGHRIHYDQRWAIDVEGHRDILVHGPLQVALMVKTITDWTGPGGSVIHISLRYKASAHPGDELRFVGRVVDKRTEGEARLVDLEIHEERGPEGQAEVLMPGRATVRLPARPGLNEGKG
jgi:acyl dehydratase